MKKTISRKDNIIKQSDLLAEKRNYWIKKNSYFYKDDYSYMKFLIGEGKRVLDLGCGTGKLLNAVNPSYGVGVDLSDNMISIARRDYPNYEFMQGDVEDESFLNSIKGKFDIIILSDTVGYFDDCEKVFSMIHSLCTPDTRIIVSYYSWMWRPILTLGEKIGLKSPSVDTNWLSTKDTVNILNLADFEMVKREWRQLIPRSMFGLGGVINRYIGTLPIIRYLSLRNYIVARPVREIGLNNPSATVLIPCRNEKGNIENAVTRLPQFCEDLEIIYVEGGSQDGTLEEINRVIKANPDKDIKVLTQDGKGKGDAVRKGFKHASGDVLIILDADLTVRPEDIPKFYNAIVSGKGEYINGTRLVYPMDNQAMRFLNFLANQVFSVIFTWLLNQRFTDTLCGTKVLTKKSYDKIASGRSYFGDFDPFGDFDLIFGATKMNLKVVELPVRYAARAYGETQISRFRHGWLLLRMVLFAYKKLKIV